MIRTTITLPEELYEELRQTAFYQKKTISELIREKIKRSLKVKKIKPGEGIKALAGIHSVKNFREVTREEIYDDIIKHKMSFGF